MILEHDRPVKDLVPELNGANGDVDPLETVEWLESLDAVMGSQGRERAAFLLQALLDRAHRSGVRLPFTANTPYVNTIPVEEQQSFPGDRELERRIKSIVRWNAMAMVVRANRECPGIGGHISTYASAATLYEVGFNHFFRGRQGDGPGDIVYFQGHASPGIYARAFVEGRLTEQQLVNFRRELQPGGGLSSYPHPWLMPDFWEYPTVSMGLGPLMAIYQARFNRYLEHRGLRDTSGAHVWAFVGDGECDEPETLGALTLASREKLDNLIFVINCNLQRLDGPVRGNGKIIQELEAAFRGAGWNVIKVIWGSDWDPILRRDVTGALVRRMNEVVDGEYQKYVVEGGSYDRAHFCGQDPELFRLLEHLNDEQIDQLRRGGHDPEKVYAAFHAAVNHTGQPTVILAKTIKGYGLGEAGEGRNISHQQKKLNEEELRQFRERFSIPISDEQLDDMPFYRPADDSPEMRYLRERRAALGGAVPRRRPAAAPVRPPSLEQFDEFLKGSGGRELSSTMAYGRMLAKLLRDPEVGRLIVPIVPDEARTFGLEALFFQVGIYSSVGQLYEPVDRSSMLYYREAKDGQILEEGITEAGSMSSFIAAGTAYASQGVSTIPFYIYYSMFGFQRVGDLIWAAADSRARGFLLGATAGRTTLSGEGLQHQDGHSHVAALAVPNCLAYDPAYAYELAVIIHDGIRRMFQAGEDLCYYITLYNENYAMPPMPEGAEEGILRGMYRLQSRDARDSAGTVQLLGSGPLLPQVLQAQDVLAERFRVSSTVWSVTSYKQLRTDALEAERWNMLHPGATRKTSFLQETVRGLEGPFVAASDHVRALPEQIAAWLPGGLTALGTDGFGRSDSREALRRFFEIDAAAIVVAALHALAERGQLDGREVARAIQELGVDADQPPAWRR